MYRLKNDQSDKLRDKSYNTLIRFDVSDKYNTNCFYTQIYSAYSSAIPSSLNPAVLNAVG